MTTEPSRLRRPLRGVLHCLLAVLAIAATLAIPTSVAPVGAASTPFDDVPDGVFYTDAVAWLADAGITTGTSPTTYSPNDVVTRAQMAAFLQRYAQVTEIDGGHGFGDVPPGAFYNEAVAFLVEREITTGTSPTTYSPNDPVTRAQMATFLWRLSFEPAADAPAPFTDVPDGVFYTDAVAWLAERGITTGTSPTTYSPQGIVTRAQMATFLWRLAGEPAVGELGANRVDTETTEVVDEADLAVAMIEPEGESVLQFSDSSAVPDEGDVVVMGVTEETPEGFIGRVEQVDGQTVTTSPASLQEAIPEADFGSTFDFDDVVEQGSGTLGTSAIRDKFKGVEATCAGGASFEVDVDLELDAGIDIEASWDPLGDGVNAYVGFSATASAGLGVNASGAVECEAVATVEGPKLRPITFWLGPVPVVLVPAVSLEVIVGGSISAEMDASIEYRHVVGAGIRYRDGRWSTEYTNEHNNPRPEVTVAGQATAGIELRARLDLKLYGAAGPYLTLGPFIEFNAQNNVPWWTIDAGVRASVGAAIDVFFFKEEVQFAEVDLARFRLAESEGPFEGDFQLLNGQPLQAISAGGTSCGYDNSGQGYCWGDNFEGQIGDGTQKDRDVATPVLGLDDIVEIESSGQHTCARHLGGRVSCWGSNQFGQLGDGTFTKQTTPQFVPGITDAVQVEVESTHTCVRHADLTVSCWGRNDDFQTGQPAGTDTTVPRKVPGVDTIVDLGLANNHTCVLHANGTVRCWGYNFGGQLGGGFVSPPPNVAQHEPVTVVGLEDAVEIDGAALATCARRAGGTVECWGEGAFGGSGDTSVPVAVPGITDATDLAFGGYHGCYLDANGAAHCWGSDFSGSLGNGAPFADSVTPVPTIDGDSYHSITARLGTVCVAYGFGVGICWGANEFGQLGIGNLENQPQKANRVQNEQTVVR